MKKVFYFFVAATCFFTSCKKDNDNTPTATGNVIVINEGGFLHGDASVTSFNPNNDSVTQNLFAKVNARPLGDVAQSILVYNNKGYIVLNNSAKIEVVDINTFASVGVIIIPGSSPRYILPVSGSKAYVSDLYSNALHIVDLDAYTVTGTVPINGETEQMELINGKAYVLNIVNYDSSWVQVVDPSSNTVTGNTYVGLRGAVSMVKDASEKLWVLCSKYDTTGTVPTGLVEINPASNAIEKTLSYPAGTTSGLSALTVAPNGTTLCYLNYSGVYKLSTADNTLPASPFISAGTHSVYGLGIDKTGKNIYVGDAVDYSSNGTVYVYTLADGAAVKNFAAGVIPGHFYFK